ncbi:MAG: radical SAM family heme chaperone HemW, partial [Candidatus Latescibacteria bacterium]|nr:radical SAM family heme chaperone HemW [Candidatus Latescibacterota bacterium]
MPLHNPKTAFKHLYLHLPFCESLCPYCDFYSVTDTEGMTRFTRSIVQEIDTAAIRYGPFCDVETMFIGGGTPTFLPPGDLETILDTIHANVAFTPGAEITTEANPESVSLETLQIFQAAGVNRLNLGVQSFDDGELEFLGRIHSSARAVEAVEIARQAGFDNVSVDLMFGMAVQTEKSWQTSLTQALSLGVEHISAYALTVEGDTAFAHSGDDHCLDDDTVAQMLTMVRIYFGEKGLKPYELSNYARPGCECRHNLGCWRRKPYLGFGPSAHSSSGNHRWWNVGDLNGYCSNVAETGSATASEEILGDSEVEDELIMLGLRLSEGLSATNLPQARWQRV